MTEESASGDVRESGRPWQRLSRDYERARAREDSLDRLVEWPAQRELLGDVTGMSILDVGCGNGEKLVELANDGARACIGVDLAADFVNSPSDVKFVQGDLSDLNAIAAIRERAFDRILFLQSFGYAADPVATLVAARQMLTEDGFIVLSRTNPVRFAVERAEANGSSLGEEYYASGNYSYASGWNDEVTLTHRNYTVADLLNQFSEAGLRVERAAEPYISDDEGRRFPHKRDWMNRYLGIFVFKLRPVDS